MGGINELVNWKEIAIETIWLWSSKNTSIFDVIKRIGKYQHNVNENFS